MRISDWSSDVCSSDLEVEIDPPGEAECRRVYDAHRSRFSTPVLTEAAHILIEPKSDDAEGWEIARQAAEDALDQLMRKPALFAQIGRASCRERGCQSV